MTSSTRPPPPRRISGFLTQRFSTQADLAFIGDVDLSDVLAEVEGQLMKGMFLAAHAETAWDALQNELKEPPFKGMYHAFEWYPMKDYLRLFDYTARARFPGSGREAYRLLGRHEIKVFADSMFGKVIFAMLGDPGAAFVRYPEIIRVIWTGPKCKAERMGPRRMKISYEAVMGPAVEHILGSLEGLVLVFNETPRIEVEVDPTRRPTFDISW